jgi:hypothetical protein
MATPAPVMQQPTLSTPLLIALVTLKGYQESRKGKKLYIEDLARYLVDLDDSDVDISRIALSRSLDKYWSEDIAQFVSEGLVFGFLKHKSPLEFTDRCLEVCKRAITTLASDNDKLVVTLRQAANVLGLENFEEILRPQYVSLAS